MALLVLLAVAVIILQREVLARQLFAGESWRAYHFSLTDGLWRELRSADAPLPVLWLVVERASILVGGNRLFALRLPVVAAFVVLGPLTYSVGRRWLSVPISFAAAGLLVLNGPIFAHAVHLKPFTLDCIASMGALWLWLLARERSLRWATRLLLYLGIAACSLLAVAAIFAVGFLLMLDMVEFLRARGWAWSRLVAPVTAGVVSVAHLVLFVLPENSVTGHVAWQGFYPPRGAVAGTAAFVVRQLAGFVPGMVTQLPPSVPSRQAVLPLGPAVRPLLTVFLLAALAAGIVAVLAGRRARVLAGLLAWCLAMELLASALHLWPFGLARPNYFLLPLVYLLGGVGVAYVLSAARRTQQRYLAGALAVVTLAGCMPLLITARAQLAQARRTAHGPVYQLHTAEMVAWTRLRASPNDVVVFYNRSGAKGWAYYMRFYQGYDAATNAAARIGPARTLVLPGAADERPLRELLRRDRTVEDVFLVLLINARHERVAALRQVLASSGYRPVARARARLTSSVQQFSRLPAAAANR